MYKMGVRYFKIFFLSLLQPLIIVLINEILINTVFLAKFLSSKCLLAERKRNAFSNENTQVFLRLLLVQNFELQHLDRQHNPHKIETTVRRQMPQSNFLHTTDRKNTCNQTEDKVNTGTCQ